MDAGPRPKAKDSDPGFLLEQVDAELAKSDELITAVSRLLDGQSGPG